MKEWEMKCNRDGRGREREREKKKGIIRKESENAQITNIVIVYNYIIFLYCNLFLLGYFRWGFNYSVGCLAHFVIVFIFGFPTSCSFSSNVFLSSFLLLLLLLFFRIHSMVLYAAIIVLNLVSIHAAVKRETVIVVECVRKKSDEEIERESDRGYLSENTNVALQYVTFPIILV